MVEHLTAEVDRKADSFKLAWHEERTAHQRDLDESAAARRAADEETRQLSASLQAAQAALKEQRHAAHAEATRLRDACEHANQRLEDVRRRGNSQLRSLQSQLARVRAEKGALCEEFTAKLERVMQFGAHPTVPLAGHTPSYALQPSSTSNASDGAASPSTPTAVVPLSAVAALPGYETLSCFQDPTGAGAQQLHSAMASHGSALAALGGGAPPSEVASVCGDSRAHDRGSVYGSSTVVGSVYGGSVYAASVVGGSVPGQSDGDSRAPVDAVTRLIPSHVRACARAHACPVHTPGAVIPTVLPVPGHPALALHLTSSRLPCRSRPRSRSPPISPAGGCDQQHEARSAASKCRGGAREAPPDACVEEPQGERARGRGRAGAAGTAN